MPSSLNRSHIISAERDPCVMLSGPEKGSDEIEALLSDVRIGHDDRNVGLLRLPDSGNDGLAVGRPDDDGVDSLLDEVFHLRDLTGDVAPPASSTTTRHPGFVRTPRMKACS